LSLVFLIISWGATVQDKSIQNVGYFLAGGAILTWFSLGGVAIIWFTGKLLLDLLNDERYLGFVGFLAGIGGVAAFWFGFATGRETLMWLGGMLVAGVLALAFLISSVG
jgi:hypothetical protein